VSDANQQAAESLRAAPIFSGCSSAELAVLSCSLQGVSVPAGTVIFREGHPGDAMYIVQSGQVRVVSDVETEKVVFAHLAPRFQAQLRPAIAGPYQSAFDILPWTH